MSSHYLVLLLSLSAIAAVSAEKCQFLAVLNGNGVSGNVTFTKSNHGVEVCPCLVGLAPNTCHGFHVHDKGDLSGGCTSAGGHFNPCKKNHGCRDGGERHVGDLGNVCADKDGHFCGRSVCFTDSVISMEPKSNFNILGRAMMVHEKTDDCGKGDNPDSKTTGNAGGRLACAVIGVLDGDCGQEDNCTGAGWGLSSGLLSTLLPALLLLHRASSA